MEITQARLRELFKYSDGNLVWKKKTSNRISIGDIAGSRRNDGYTEVRVDGNLYLLHRLVYLYFHGKLPQEIDHIDRDRSNSKIENLREATSSQNKCNRGMQSNNSSGRKGVYRHTDGRWRAEIALGGQKCRLGVFDEIEDAYAAYCEAAIRLHGEFCAV